MPELETIVKRYLTAKELSRGTRDQYFSTLRKWKLWGRTVPLEKLDRKEICEFLDWVHKRAVAQEGANPGLANQ